MVLAGSRDRNPMKRAFQPDLWPRKQTKRQAETIKLAVARNRWFESISLQRRERTFGSSAAEPHLAAFQSWLLRLGVRYLTGGSDVGYILSAGRGDMKYQPISLRPNNERLHGPPPDVQPARCAHAMKRSRAEQSGDNQVGRARVLEVRIHSPPADSPSLAGFFLPVSKSRQLPQRMRARPGRMVGRDTQGSPTSRQLPVMSLSSPIPVPQHRSAGLPAVVALVRQARSGHPGTWRCDQALSSVRLRESRARPAARASRVADENAPAACLRSDRAADGRRGWLR